MEGNLKTIIQNIVKFNFNNNMKKNIKLSEMQLCTIVRQYQLSNNLNDLLPVVNSLYGLICCIARKRPEQGAVQLEDLVQEGILGLFLAAKEFQPQTSNSFTSFARNYIADAIRTFYTANSLPVSRPAYSGTQLSIESIDSYTYDTFDNEENEPAPILPQTLISRFTDNDSEQCFSALQQALDTLSPLERKLIDLSVCDDTDDCSIARQFNITLLRLRQIRNHTLRKMQLLMQSAMNNTNN